jgi:hypothetical protein
MIAFIFLTWLFTATLFVGLAILRWWYIDKSPPIRKANLGSYAPEPERTAEDFPLQGIDLD